MTVIGVKIQTPLPQLVVGQTVTISALIDPAIEDSETYPVSITWSLIEGPAEGSFDSLVNGQPDATSIDFTPTASGPGRIQVEYTVGTARAVDTVAINLIPVVDLVEPSYGVLGTTVQAVITGKNLARVTEVSLLPETGVTGTLKPGKTETTLPVEFVIAPSAAPGSRVIVLGVPEGQINTGKMFELRTPPAITADPSSLSLLTGQTGNITFSIPDTAPPGGVQLVLSSSVPIVATVPGSATIPEGQSSVVVTVTAVSYGQTVITANAVGYYRAQVPITVINPPLISFSPSTLTVAKGLVQKCTVSISNPAPDGGLVVNLSGGGGLVDFPSSVVIQPAKQSGQFQVRALQEGSTIITASAVGYPSADLPVTVGPGQLVLFPSYLPIAAGRSSTLQLMIPNEAPPGGLVVDISSSNTSVVAVPSAVTIPEGQKSAQVPVTGIIAGQAVVTAILEGFTSAQATVNVLPTFNISFLPSSLVMPPGVTKSTDVVISAAAPAGGLTITLSNPSPDKFSMPESVFIPEGMYSATVAVTGLATTDQPVEVVATCPGLTEGILQVTVQPILALYMRADVKVGVGCRTSGSIGLTSGSAPPGGYTVNVSVDDPEIASVPPQVTIPAGSSWTSFTIVGNKPGITNCRLTLLGFEEVDTVTVGTPTFVWDSVMSLMNLGQTDSVRVYTYVPGGSYGYGNYVYSDTSQNVDQALTISVTSTNPSVISVPSVMLIPSGRYYADWITVTAVGAGSARLVASAVGWDMKESSEITVTGVTPYMRADVTVGAGCRTSGSVGLSVGSAPVGGYTFYLSSDDPGVASVPSQVTIPYGSSWQSFTIVGVSPGSTKIRLSVPAELGGYTEEDTVTVVTPTFAWDSVPSQLTIGAVDNVRVYTYVPGGSYGYGNYVYSDAYQNVDQAVIVTLMSQNAGVIQMPATTSIGAGRYYSDYVNVSAVGTGTSTLTASASGFAYAVSGLITVVGPWLRADVTVGAGCRTTGYVGLVGGVAPSGGYTVYLSVDNPDLVSVPGTVTIPSGSSQTSFSIEGLAVGSTFTQMSVSGFIDRDRTTVVAPTFEWLSVATSLNVGQSDSVYIQTYVPGGTYASGNGVYTNTNQAVRSAVTIAISSENPSVLVAPETVTIAAGNTWSGWFNMTAVGPGTSKLTASAVGWNPAQTDLITVNPAGAKAPLLPVWFEAELPHLEYGVVGAAASERADNKSACYIDALSAQGGPVYLILPASALIGSQGKLESDAGTLDGWNSGPRIEYNVITGNNAGAGGAIAVYNSSVTVLGNIIVANSATSDVGGGAIYIDGALANAVVRSNTICANTAVSGVGGGIYLAAGTAAVTNCILWQNTDDLFGCSTTYSNVTDINSDPGTGNISADPQFVQTSDPMLGHYFHLNSASPCVNAGDPNYVPMPGETDIDGEARISSGRVDIGADELPDFSPPETTITGGPSQGSTACSLPVNFSWQGTDDTPIGITYSYRIDNSDWSGWSASNSVSFASLPDGPHTFEVKARDGSGNEDPTPARCDFLLDTTAPVISQVTPNAGRTSAIITWVTNEGATSQVLYGPTDALGQATYINWVYKTNHAVTITNLLPNTTYYYQVRSLDKCGYESTSELFALTTALDTTSPDTQITSGPSPNSIVCSLPVTFTFTGGDDSTPVSLLTYAYRVDGGAWSDFSASTTASITELTSGPHTFEVRAKDVSGNEDDTPAARSFVVMLDPAVISNVQSNVAQMQCTITWTTNVPCTSKVLYGETASYGLESPEYGSLVTSHSVVINGLDPGKTYHYAVRSKDSCGREVISGDHTFTTPPDTGEPNTWFTSGPSEGGLVCSTSQQFCWSGSDTLTPTDQLTYSYKLDSGSWSTPTPETCRTFTSLTEGTHTLYVRAHDTSGNVDSSPAQRTFRVDLSTGTISNVNAAAGSVEATVVWRTSEAMDSQVEYGTTPSYGSVTPPNPALVTDHSVVITNLLPETTYHYRVRSRDGCGREVVSGNYTFTTKADKTAPQTVITSGPPANGKACSTVVDFCWSGNDDATPIDQLVYSYKMDEGSWSDWTAEVCRQFTNLSEGLHTFMVKAKDSVGNEDASPAVRYFYVDLTSPTISEGSVTASPRQSTCIINWRTGEPATAQVEYGTTPAYGKISAVDPNMLSVHKITISGLTPETTYHYRVRSSDGCQEVVSEDYTFTTTAVQPPNLRPTQLSSLVTTFAHSTVNIKWTVQNAGPGDAEGSWTDKLYFSEDELIDAGDTLLWEGTGSSPLAVPYTYSKQVDIQMPMKPVGLYYLILKTDADGSLSETNELDNVFVQPITFTADKPLIAAPGAFSVRLDPQVAAYGQFDLSNIGDRELTGISAVVVDAPANISLIVSNVVPTMAPLTNRRISYQLTAIDESVLTASPKVVFTTNEGASATVTFDLTVRPRQPKLVANPGYLAGPMVRGKQTFYECEIINQGGVPANDLRVLIPAADWLSLVTPADLGTLAPGEKKTVGLSLMPPADMPLGDYTSNFVVVGTNANVSVGFRFTCVSTQIGGLKVYAEDEFTTFAEDHPYVSGARVVLKDYSTGESKYEGITGPDGVWLNDNIIEANYYLEVSAEKHGTYRSPIQIVAGQTKEVHAFIPRQLVTYKWTVEPIMIEDKYRVVLEATFETHVPAPVVTIEPRTQVVPVVEGQTAISYITVTNHGLISAHEVEVRINDTANWYVTPAIRQIGELPAMTSVRVPIYVRAKSDGPITELPDVATSTLSAEAALAAASTTSTANLNEGGGTTGGGQPSLCDILSGAVVHIVYCSGGQWKTADFSLSPLFLLLDLLDGLGCLTGNIQSCLSLACSLAKVDPCICALIDPLSAGGAVNIAQCLACHGFPGGGGGAGPGGGGAGTGGGGGVWWGPGNISGPASIEEEVPCDPATRPQGLFGVFNEFAPEPIRTVTITSPPDIARYGGKLVRYRVNLLP